MPYSCIHLECPYRHDLIFTTLDEWERHDKLYGHQWYSEWRCVDCYKVFPRKELFKTHVLESHLGDTPEMKAEGVGDIVNACGRGGVLWECLFCGTGVGGSIRDCRSHVGMHMLNLALKVLPQRAPEGEPRVSNIESFDEQITPFGGYPGGGGPELHAWRELDSHLSLDSYISKTSVWALS